MIIRARQGLVCAVMFHLLNATHDSPVLSTCPLHTNSGCGKERRKAGRPGSSEVPCNPLTGWDVSSIPANGIFLTKKK